MKHTLAALLLGGIPLQAAKTLPCDLRIDIRQTEGSEILLTLRHDKQCRITIDRNDSHIRMTVRDASKRDSTSPPLHHPAKSEKIEKIIALAKSKLGNSYQSAKAGPDHFDCSGFVYYVFTSNNIQIPRSSIRQSKNGKALKRSEIKKGDILFFDTAYRQHINHSGIYLGNGKFIHSSSGHAHGVTISDLDKGFYKDKFRWGIRKIEAR